MQPNTRVCRHCGKRRPISFFFKTSGSKAHHTGYRPECKACTYRRRQQLKEQPA